MFVFLVVHRFDLGKLFWAALAPGQGFDVYVLGHGGQQASHGRGRQMTPAQPLVGG